MRLGGKGGGKRAGRRPQSVLESSRLYMIPMGFRYLYSALKLNLRACEAAAACLHPIHCANR